MDCGQTTAAPAAAFPLPDRELSRAEYGRLLSAARGLGRERLGRSGGHLRHRNPGE